MAEEANVPAAPQGETEATPNTNPNPAPAQPEASQAPQATQAPQAPAVDLHGLDPNQLGDIAKFLESNGGFDKVKSRLSNPTPAPEKPAQSEAPAQPAQPQAPAQPPKGYASLNELAVERYFKDLAADPKYATIAEQISNGEILKEMAQMGMSPIDENYNVNVDQLGRFLELKAASVPAQPASAPVGTTPTAEYMEVGENIASKDEALQVLRQSMEYESRGIAPHPAKQKAEEYLKQNWGK